MTDSIKQCCGQNPVCAECGQPSLVHLILDQAGAYLAVAYCEPCARRILKSSVVRELVSYCANLRTGDSDTMIMKNYAVVRSEGDGITVRVREQLSGKRSGFREWNVPAALVPETERHEGGKFAVNGNPLDIEIFETWF